MIKTQEEFFIKIYTSHFIARVRKVIQGLRVRGIWRPNINCNILTPKLWSATLCLSRSSLDPNSIRAPDSPFGRVWLSLPRLTPTGTWTQLSSVQFIGLILPSNSHAEIWTRLHASAISSDIWRSGCVTSAIFGMACVIVMQFTGHCLPVRQSMSVPWEFFYLVPFHQPISAHAISSHNCHWNVSLPSGASPWMAFWAESKGQNITHICMPSSCPRKWHT